MSQLAILTGDLITPARPLTAPQLDQAMLALRSAARLISDWGPTLRSNFARQGNSGWQIALDNPQLDLRAALYLKASLRILGKGFSSRIALARGPGRLSPSGKGASAARDTIARSQACLDGLTGPHITMSHASGGTLQAVTLLADRISQSWTPAQSKPLRAMLPLQSGTHAAVAARLGITRQAVDQALAASGYHALSNALAEYEK